MCKEPQREPAASRAAAAAKILESAFRVDPRIDLVRQERGDFIRRENRKACPGDFQRKLHEGRRRGGACSCRSAASAWGCTANTADSGVSGAGRDMAVF